MWIGRWLPHRLAAVAAKNLENIAFISVCGSILETENGPILFSASVQYILHRGGGEFSPVPSGWRSEERVALEIEVCEGAFDSRDGLLETFHRRRLQTNDA